MAVQEDRAALRRALAQTIPALTVVEVESREHARAFAEEMKALVAGRPCETLDLIARPAHTNRLFEEARRVVSSWPAGEGVLFLVDETPGEAGDATEFWRTLNLQREQWGSLAAHVVFVLRPDNYRLLLRAADHLAAWMPLKFDLREPPEPWGTLQQQTAMAASSGKDIRSSQLTLRLLEEDLNDYLAGPEQDQRILLHRFYLPMAKAAVDNARVAVDRKMPERACEYARHARDIARKEGDAAAEANALVLLGGAYQSLPRGDRGENLEEAIACYEAALQVFTEADFPQEWAGTQNNLGYAYAQLPRGDRGASLEQAIACYEAALRVYTEVDFPQGWAGTQNNLGNAYVQQPRGDRGANLEQAIACYKAALRVYTETDFPQEWAMTQNNLGNAYRHMPLGDRGANLEQAVACYEAALRVYTEADFPQQWATAQNNLGSAYADLPWGDRGANLEQAIACYEAALRIRSETDFPQQWAMTQYNLGSAYAQLPRGDRGANLEQAIACYKAALRVYTETDFPQEWAMTQNNLGNAYDQLPRGDRGENLEEAIACYERALTVYTEEAFPHRHAMVNKNLAKARAALAALHSDKE